MCNPLHNGATHTYTVMYCKTYIWILLYSKGLTLLGFSAYLIWQIFMMDALTDASHEEFVRSTQGSFGCQINVSVLLVICKLTS